MNPIIMILVFSMVLLIFMIFPAIKIVEFLKTKMELNEKAYNILTILLTIILSLISGTLIYIL